MNHLTLGVFLLAGWGIKRLKQGFCASGLALKPSTACALGYRGLTCRRTGLRAFRRLRGDLLQLARLDQNHAAALELDPVRPLPNPQLFVGHFARQTNDLADVALGNLGLALLLVRQL